MKISYRLWVVSVGVWLAAGPVQAQPEKFSLSMFHFNVQYVAGGLTGFPSGEDDNPNFDLSDAEVQDLIIVESFEPILDLFLAHPDWKVTLEMQAYMVEIMIERHPDVLSKLVQLVTEGRAELVSFHWSDQLFLAYPRLDLERSHQLMDAVWEEAGLRPSEVVFCQEGQFGVGMGPFAAERGRSVLVLPKNLFRYQHFSDLEQAPPLFELDGVAVVLGARSFATGKVQVVWSFFDDGELLATNGQNPYMGKNFKVDQTSMDEYEQDLLAAEADGFRIATITEFVDWAKANGVPSEPLPPVLDGTWQPPSTDSMHRWMGASGLIDSIYGGERDNDVLTGNVRARHRILAAETLVAHARERGWIESGEHDTRLEECWREVLLAQVSDASGINPFVGEVEYGLAHAAAAMKCADEVIAEVAPAAGGPFVVIDSGSGAVFAADDQPGDLSRQAVPYFDEQDGFSAAAQGRDVNVTWREVGQEEGLLRVTISFGPAADGQRTAEVAFPLRLEGFFLTPGLSETDAVFHPFSEFDFQEGRITLPLANGLVGLDDDVWLIKQTSSVHIGATFEVGSGKVRFIDQTMDPDAGAEWVFWVVQGSEDDALALADRLNLHPVAWVETGVGRDRGCGCSGAGNGSLGIIAGLYGLFGIWAARRRRIVSFSGVGKSLCASSQPSTRSATVVDDPGPPRFP